MYDIRTLIYSLDTSISLGDLRKGLCPTEVDGSALSDWMHERNIQAQIVGEDAHYGFESLVQKPYIVYSQGDVSLLDRQCIAIVGPRKMSEYQERVLRDFFSVLKLYDVVTISGGASGVDALVHELSLAYEIPTVMVLGTGFRSALASHKRHLIHRVVGAGGCVLSEFRLWQKAAPWTFPQRNRIIAGLADMVFLPGAAKKSGSLITVDFARKMHVPVYTIPGSIYDVQHAGSNAYMSKQKIGVITDAHACLGLYFTKRLSDEISVATFPELSQESETVLHAFQGKVCTLAQLCSGTGFSSSQMLVCLSELELEGLVLSHAGGSWSTNVAT